MDIKLADVNRYSPLQLAYLGDSVYELYIRSYLLSQGFFSPGELNMRAKNYVKASAQAKAYRALEASLDDRELTYLKRGRNAKGGAGPASSSLGDYRRATGLESLIGALYVEGNHQRIDEIMQLCIASLGDHDEKMD